MPLSTVIARPYAKAAFEFALQKSALEKWSAMLKATAFIVSDITFLSFFKNPKITRQERFLKLMALCDGLVDDITQKNFLKLLEEKNRLNLLPAISDLFDSYGQAQQTSLHALVFSAHALQTHEEIALAKALTSKWGKEVKLTFSVDASLIAGFIIRIGDRVMDYSIRTRFEHFSQFIGKGR